MSMNKVKLSPGIWKQWYRDSETKKPLTGERVVEIIIDGTEYQFPQFMTTDPDLKYESIVMRLR